MTENSLGNVLVAVIYLFMPETSARTGFKFSLRVVICTISNTYLLGELINYNKSNLNRIVHILTILIYCDAYISVLSIAALSRVQAGNYFCQSISGRTSPSATRPPPRTVMGMLKITANLL